MPAGGTIVMEPEQLRATRASLLRQTNMTWDELREAAENYLLRANERGIYEAIRSIDYLLGGNA